MKITMHPIGVIHSPYKEPRDIPIQGIFKPDVEAWVELKKQYCSALKDLDEFSHAILLYHFHRSTVEQLQGRPFLEDDEHGIFAIRSPHRPNHIGLSVVKVRSIEGNKLYFSQVDVLDGTPVLDIKPYVKYFDARDDVVSGWVDKHFEGGPPGGGQAPDRTVLR